MQAQLLQQLEELPQGDKNIRNAMVKFTMGKASKLSALNTKERQRISMSQKMAPPTRKHYPKKKRLMYETPESSHRVYCGCVVKNDQGAGSAVDDDSQKVPK